jgi:hypothetical protein
MDATPVPFVIATVVSRPALFVGTTLGPAFGPMGVGALTSVKMTGKLCTAVVPSAALTVTLMAGEIRIDESVSVLAAAGVHVKFVSF